jgi:hypothetical protein
VNLLRQRLDGLDAWFARRTACLTHPRAGLIAALLLPLLCGLLSVWNGQDDGWDLRNYHLYNAYAALNGRLDLDFSPAGFQTYFNPTIDLLYHGLNHVLSPRLAGFAMGALHGVNFVLLAAIARLLIGGAGDGAQRRLALLLAGVGLLGPGFLSELGNTMGDNLTALLVLAALYLVLREADAWRRWSARGAPTLLAAGLLMGMGTGLKLTNAVYAVALCAALLSVEAPWWQRLRLAFVAGVGVLAGCAATAGWWFLAMWRRFDNPLFPQFNNLFHSVLAAENGVIDTAFRPQGPLEYLAWPFLFMLNPRRVSEVPMTLALWPVVYLLFGALALAWLLRRGPALPARVRYTLVFFGVGYVCWMAMFGIYRYLIPLELLAPLVIWLLWRQIAPASQWLAGVVLAALALSAFPAANWGHADWAEQAYQAEVPAFAAPSSSIVFLATPNPPSGWMATLFPPQVQFIAIGTGFPESPAWVARKNAAIAARGGPHYVLMPVAKNSRAATLRHKLEAARALGLTDDAAGCDKLAWLGRHVRLQAELRRLPSGACTLGLLPRHQEDLAARDRATMDAATHQMRQAGLRVDTASCKVYAAALGREPYPYRLCGASVGTLP